ncbi:MAG: NADH-quinone oxidoreductase subunit J [Chloroflexota bacterium]|jgi:NADH:ubiquinone oxidoreductase subunit 6 (subunit J)
MMLYALLMVAILVFAIQAIRAERLLHSAIWLAGVSALLAIVFYQLGAYQVAVIELSVGAGLVTVLFVFAIGMAGEDRINLRSLIPKPLAWGLVIAAMLLLGWLALPSGPETAVLELNQPTVVGNAAAAQTTEEPIQVVIWEQRGLDVLVQVVLIFSGVLGILGLLAEAKGPLQKPAAEEMAAVRDRELLALEESVLQQEKELA